MVKMIQIHAENAQWANKILPSIIKLTDALVLSTFIDFKATLHINLVFSCIGKPKKIHEKWKSAGDSIVHCIC